MRCAGAPLYSPSYAWLEEPWLRSADVLVPTAHPPALCTSSGRHPSSRAQRTSRSSVSMTSLMPQTAFGRWSIGSGRAASAGSARLSMPGWPSSLQAPRCASGSTRTPPAGSSSPGAIAPSCAPRQPPCRRCGSAPHSNENVAFALAVDSAVPVGVPRVAIVDVAPVSHGHIGRDRVAFADFIPNNWSAWPNTYQHVDILERGPRQVRIRAVRDWGKVNIVTVYSLSASSDQVEIRTTMTNGGDETLTDLLSGLTLWPRSGFLFAVPGLAAVSEGKADGALADRVVAYDAGWAITLHAPYLDHIGSASRDLFQLHTLQPHQSRTFTGWLQVGSSGDLAPVVRAEIERRQLPSGTLRGSVGSRDGKALRVPVVVRSEEHTSELQ